MKQWLYLLFTLGFIFFLFRLVNIKEAVSLLSRTRGPLIVLATVLGIVQSFLLSLRLQVLLSILARISILYLWALGFLSALVSHLFPFWIGGLGLVSVVAKKIKVSLAKTLAVVALSPTIDLAWALLLGLVGQCLDEKTVEIYG